MMRAIIAAALAATVVAAQPADFVVRLEALLGSAFKPDEPGGVVLVARDGKPIFRRAYGMADIENSVRMTPEAVMRIGSITKQFTAVAILELAEQGKLALQDDVRRYVPELQTHGRTVTIEHLLTHTSGLATLVDIERFPMRARADHDLAALLALTGERAAHFEPGSAFRYNDTGYIALGAVIERVSGGSYAASIESLVRPLGMRDTWYGDDPRIIPRRARGYSEASGRIVNAPYISMTVPHAAGALISTADDLVRWTSALRRGEVIGRALLDKAWTAPVLPDGAASGYGFGWSLCESGGRQTVEHGGWINGFTSTMMTLRDEDLTVVVLVNRDTESLDAAYLAHRVMRLALTGSPDLPSTTLDAAARRALVGTYRGNGPADVYEITEQGETLYLASRRGKPERLVALAPTALTTAVSEGTFVLRFRLGAREVAEEFRTFVNCERGERRSRIG